MTGKKPAFDLGIARERQRVNCIRRAILAHQSAPYSTPRLKDVPTARNRGAACGSFCEPTTLLKCSLGLRVFAGSDPKETPARGIGGDALTPRIEGLLQFCLELLERRNVVSRHDRLVANVNVEMPYFEGSGKKARLKCLKGTESACDQDGFTCLEGMHNVGQRNIRLQVRGLWEDSMRNDFCRRLQATFAGMLATGLVFSSFGVQAGQVDGARPSPQSITSTPVVRTIFHDEVVNETVYDTETVQVPVTTNETRYRTEYRTRTVPVTRTVTEQVPVTQTQTLYRTEYRTQTVPVTRTITEQVPETTNPTQYRIEYRNQTVPETHTVAGLVNVPRTLTDYVPRSQTINQQVTRTVYNPVTTMQNQRSYVTVTRPVTRTVLQPRTTTVMTSRIQTRMVPETYTESVPVTTTRQVVENVGTYETGPGPVATSQAEAGSVAGGYGTAVRPLEQSYNSRPVVRTVPETSYVTQTRTRLVPRQEVVQVPECRTEMVPVTVNETVALQQLQETTVPVTTMQASQVTETVPVTNTVLVPEQRTEMMPTTQYRQVTENVTHQVGVRVPYEAPVTVYTSRQRQVTENVTQQVSEQVPYQVPVTTYTTRQKQVTEKITEQYPVQVAYQVPVTTYRTEQRKVARQVPVIKRIWDSSPSPSTSAVPSASPQH